MPWLNVLSSALHSLFQYRINKASMHLQDQRENPCPIAVDTRAYILLSRRVISFLVPPGFPRSFYPSSHALHVKLYLSNPGDNPIYLKVLTIDKWELQDFLIDRSKFIRDPNGNLVIIPPRDKYYLGINFFLTNSGKVVERIEAGKGKKARLVLEFTGGTKTGKLPIDVEVAGLLI